MLTSDEVKKTVRVLDRMAHLSLFEVNLLLTSAGMDSVGVDFDGYSIWDEDAETRKNYLRGCLEQKQYSNEILQNWNESLDALSSLEKENRLAKSESEDLFIKTLFQVVMRGLRLLPIETPSKLAIGAIKK